MAETTAHEPGQLTERWKCKACAEPWDLVHGQGAQRCPECGGPLRLIPGPSTVSQDLAAHAPAALSGDQHRLVGQWPGDSTPWAVLKRLDAIGGSPATHERRPIRVEHTAAD